MKNMKNMKKCRFIMVLILILTLTITDFSGISRVTVYASGSWMDAYNAINAAMREYQPTNDVTAEEFLQVAKDAVVGYDVTLEIYNFKIDRPATEQYEGSVSAQIEITAPDQKAAWLFGATIPRIINDTEKRLNEDRSLLTTAVKELEVSNDLTKEVLLDVAKGAIKNGTTIAWKSFTKIDATYESAGSISGYFSTELEGMSKELRYKADIPKLQRKMPAKKLNNGELDLTSDEWETLRQTNVERYKEGLTLLTMVQPLQGVTCVRAKEEINSKTPDHKRPDGSSFSSAVPSSFKHNGLGENLLQCKKGAAADPTGAVVGWMNSSKHRTNILKKKNNYIGITMVGRLAIQVFAVSKYKIKSFKTSTGSKTFETDADINGEYLICTDTSGQKSYLPLDTSYMKKVKNGYTINLNSKKTIKLTVKKFVLDNPSFTDVEAGDKDAALWVAKNGYMLGINKTEFGPKLSCTRADVMTYLYRANGSPMPKSEDLFPDVDSTDTFYKPALWAEEKGLVEAGLFNPDDVCLRGYALYYVWKSVGSPTAKAKTTFTDVSNSVFYAKAVAWAEEKGIIKNSGDGCFHGDDWVCTRADMAHFLYGAYKK